MTEAETLTKVELDAAAVLASYARCRERGGFVESFYRELWARDPHWSSTLEQQWRAALKPGLDYMAERY